MLFNSFNFLIFFPIVVLIYYVMPKKVRYIWLLVASYYFYMGWNPKYAFLIALSTFITWISGLGLEKWKKSKTVVAVSFISNLGILIAFKYFDFMLNNINEVLGRVGISLISKPFDVLLPVGISFYTFQALSYTMDVYRGEIKAEKNILRYGLFVSFFPQLVAGPIERSGRLLTQIQEIPEKIKFDMEKVYGGLLLILWGLFQKMVIADRIAILVNQVFDTYYMYHSFELIIAAIGFALQIYCDFASYSTIAIGAAKVMGFSLMENFETPYFATSIPEFWRRWHISLSTWFRDYLYIPLGGSRCSKWKKYRNIMITFLVSGLWHGANWTFLAWGGLHGFYQIVGMELKGVKSWFCKKLGVETEVASYGLLQGIITFILVDIAWIFFRADTIKDGLYYIQRIVTKANPWAVFDGTLYTLGLNRIEMNILLWSVLLLIVVDLIYYCKKIRFEKILMKQNLWFQVVGVLILVGSIWIFGKYGTAFDAQQFIYFQF